MGPASLSPLPKLGAGSLHRSCSETSATSAAQSQASRATSRAADGDAEDRLSVLTRRRVAVSRSEFERLAAWEDTATKKLRCGRW